MTSLRTLLSGAVILLLGLGYMASQIFAMQGRGVEWMEKIDSTPIVLLALLLLLGSAVLAFIPDAEKANGDDE